MNKITEENPTADRVKRFFLPLEKLAMNPTNTNFIFATGNAEFLSTGNDERRYFMVEVNPTADEACRLAAEEDGHDMFHAEECLEGGEFLDCDGCPFA